jgi:hypothetical protein
VASSTASSWIQLEALVHMIVEHACHCGHGDLLRERIDALVGR